MHIIVLYGSSFDSFVWRLLCGLVLKHGQCRCVQPVCCQGSTEGCAWQLEERLVAAVANKDKLKTDCIDQLRRRGAAVQGGDPVFEESTQASAHEKFMDASSDEAK